MWHPPRPRWRPARSGFRARKARENRRSPRLAGAHPYLASPPPKHTHTHRRAAHRTAARAAARRRAPRRRRPRSPPPPPPHPPAFFPLPSPSFNPPAPVTPPPSPLAAPAAAAAAANSPLPLRSRPAPNPNTNPQHKPLNTQPYSTQTQASRRARRAPPCAAPRENSMFTPVRTATTARRAARPTSAGLGRAPARRGTRVVPRPTPKTPLVVMCCVCVADAFCRSRLSFQKLAEVSVSPGRARAQRCIFMVDHHKACVRRAGVCRARVQTSAFFFFLAVAFLRRARATARAAEHSRPSARRGRAPPPAAPPRPGLAPPPPPFPSERRPQGRPPRTDRPRVVTLTT